MPIPFLVDHDGGIDDFPALHLMLRSPGVEVSAVTVMPADSYKEPAVLATKRLLDYLGARHVTIAASDFPGVNPFPDKWRGDAARVASLPFLEDKTSSNRVLSITAEEHLVELLSGSRRYSLLATGPLSNVAGALDRNPDIKRNVERLYFMGGAVNVAGNVDEPGHDGTAEWNVYCDPGAAEVVFNSGIPITMVPLDATNGTPLTREFLGRLTGPLARGVWGLAARHLETTGYYLWDTLTAAIVSRPEIASLRPMRLRVLTSGPSQGRTIESADGALTEVAVAADREALEALLVDRLRD